MREAGNRGKLLPFCPRRRCVNDFEVRDVTEHGLIKWDGDILVVANEET